MEGPGTDRGVNFKSMQELFRIREEKIASGEVDYTLKVSMLEVYNGT